MKRTFALTVLLAVACSSGPEKRRDRVLEERRQAEYEAAIAKGEIRMGMTKRMVRAAWGRPDRTDRTTRGARTVERWWYPSVFVYFHEDGYVIGWDAPY